MLAATFPLLASVSLSFSPNNLDLSANAGSTQKVSDTTTLSNNGSSSTSYSCVVTASFISSSPFQGNLNAGQSITVTVFANPTGLQAGNYTGQLRCSGGGSTAVLTVNFSVNGAAINVSTSNISLSGTKGDKKSGTFGVTTVGGGGTNVSVNQQSGGSWLSVNPGSGNTPVTFTVTADSSQLAPGDYSGSYVVTCNSAPCLAQTVGVQFSVAAAGPVLNVDKTSLSFTAAAGSITAQKSTVNLSNSGTFTNFNVAVQNGGTWLTVVPSNASVNNGETVQLTITADPSRLEAATYNGIVVISAGSTTLNIPVTLNVTGIQISVSTTQLSFSAQAGQKAATQTFRVDQVTGSGNSVTATVQAGAPWLTINPGSGTAPLTITVTADATTLQAGVVTSVITIGCTTACLQKTVTVTFTVNTTVKLSLDQSAVTLAANVGSTIAQTVQVNLTNSGPNSAFTTTATSTLNWLSVTPPSASIANGATMPLNIAANASSLIPGTYTGNVSVFVPGVLAAVNSITVTLTVAKFTPISSADYASGLAPGTIAAAFATGISSLVQSATSATLPLNLNSVTINVKDAANKQLAAGLFFVSPNQANFEVPENAATGTAVVTIQNGAGIVASGNVQIVAVAPSLYTANAQGSGPPAAFIRYFASNNTETDVLAAQCDANANCTPVPIDMSRAPTVFLELYGTGIRNRTDQRNVTANIGGTILPVAYAGAQNQYPGLDQVDIALTPGLAGKGIVTVVLTVDGISTKPVTVQFN
jgi:uncharacterized protein (TIGR03437 family)